MNRLGVVIIGRNEGERLRRCLQSVLATRYPAVYVDSGSDDGSVELAAAMGLPVETLGSESPFTAALARNAGARWLQAAHPDLELVQFVDGDCELVPGWIESAAAALRAGERIAAVCGRRRELARNSSVYRRLCDIEWEIAPGEVQACGGDALFDVRAFESVGGFDVALAAGEEPELCLRLRQRGWAIVSLALDMTIHDSGMISFSQWWRRSRRAGFAYTSVAALHGFGSERFWLRESASISFWGAALPLSIAASSGVSPAIALVLASMYPALFVRIYRRARAGGSSSGDAALFAAACIIGKLPQLSGQARYLFGGNRNAGRARS